MSKQISESRKAVFYIGTGLVVVGVPRLRTTGDEHARVRTQGTRGK